MNPVTIFQGNGPIVLGQPHSGTFVPEDILARLNETGRQLIDTDWHVPRLYDGLIADVTIVRANFSRYVIDANRPPDGAVLYPGQNGTELVPTRTFDGAPIWHSPPTPNEIADRLTTYHGAYHNALMAEITRVKEIHGIAILYDCHSIRSEIPFLFDNRLPDLNIGTFNGTTCARELTDAVTSVCSDNPHFSFVVNGRFKGGWTTRHYGRPHEGVHAIQMELAQRTYLAAEIPPFEYSESRAAPLRTLLRDILAAVGETAAYNLIPETRN